MKKIKTLELEIKGTTYPVGIFLDDHPLPAFEWIDRFTPFVVVVRFGGDRVATKLQISDHSFAYMKGNPWAMIGMEGLDKCLRYYTKLNKN